jgi:hypothetical protein
MSSRRKPADSKTNRSRGPDDLTVIEGIGDTRQRWFRESLGVRTYRELAALSTEDIEAGLKAEKQTVSRTAIETWVAQARHLAGTAERPSPIPKQADQRDWAPFASFVVEFQSREREEVAGRRSAVAFRTAVHHVEADEDKHWLGIESELLSRWMLEKAESERPPAGAVAGEPEERRAEEEDRPRLEVTEIRLVQGTEADAPRSVTVHGQAFSAPVKSDEPFAAEVSFELSGAASRAAAPEGEKYLVQLYAENLATAAKTHLGDSVPVPMEPEGGSYAAVLPESTLASGIYRLTVLTRRAENGAFPDHLDAPLLRVV